MKVYIYPYLLFDLQDTNNLKGTSGIGLCQKERTSQEETNNPSYNKALLIQCAK